MNFFSVIQKRAKELNAIKILKQEALKNQLKDIDYKLIFLCFDIFSILKKLIILILGTVLFTILDTPCFFMNKASHLGKEGILNNIGAKWCIGTPFACCRPGFKSRRR